MTRRLHIGGTVRKEGWEVLNALPGDHVDHLGNATDLSRFPDGTFACIYASHVLEHFDYGFEVTPTLTEWNRVLTVDGRLLISVPDLATICALFCDRHVALTNRFMLMRMIFGGHVDAYDYHKVGYDEDILSNYLRSAGFAGCHRVVSHGLFQDTSEMVFLDRRISLNVVAYKTWDSSITGSEPPNDDTI